MRVLLILKSSPTQRYLVKIHTKDTIREVKDLINQRKLNQAMTTIFRKGRFEKKISECDLPRLETDLILSKTAARWDITR